MMRVEESTLARVYSFDLKFKGGKRTQFYRNLFGFKSKTSREDGEGREKVYENFYPGVLTPLPHLRLGKSVIAVPKNSENQIDEFFDDPRWGEIDLYSFDGILPHQDRMRAMEEVLERIKIRPGVSLESEIGSLRKFITAESRDTDWIQRAEKVLDRCDELMEYDWTDDFEFSEELNKRISPIRSEID